MLTELLKSLLVQITVSKSLPYWIHWQKAFSGISHSLWNYLHDTPWGCLLKCRWSFSSKSHWNGFWGCTVHIILISTTVCEILVRLLNGMMFHLLVVILIDFIFVVCDPTNHVLSHQILKLSIKLFLIQAIVSLVSVSGIEESLVHCKIWGSQESRVVLKMVSWAIQVFRVRRTEIEKDKGEKGWDFWSGVQSVKWRHQHSDVWIQNNSGFQCISLNEDFPTWTGLDALHPHICTVSCVHLHQYPVNTLTNLVLVLLLTVHAAFYPFSQHMSYCVPGRELWANDSKVNKQSFRTWRTSEKNN